MKSFRRRLVTAFVVGTLLSLLPAHAGIIRFNATIDGAQAGTNSASTGSAVVLYDVTANTVDLLVTLNNFPNPLTNSHIHEDITGAPVVAGFGAEALYTRNGSTLTATFVNIPYTGTPATLLSGDAYLNFHTAAFPAGEIRGNLIPEPAHLTAKLDAASEVGAHTPVDSDAYGAVHAIYDPMTNQITTLVCLYNFTNTLTDSHIHEAPVTGSGPPTLGFGGASAYIASGTTYVQQFGPSTYSGSAANLLSERAYVNAHSNIYGPGEIRGQLLVAEPPQNDGRLVNVSSRAQVGTGDNVLISGFFVQGDEPLRVLVTARGPSTGLSGALANPSLALYDAQGRLLFTNDDVASAPFQTLIDAFPSVTLQAAESAVLLVLPPGGYTGVVSGAGGTTGVGLGEAFEVDW